LKKIYPSGALQLLPMGKSFVFVAAQSEKTDNGEKSFVVSYKIFNEQKKISLASRHVYLLSKFGNNFEFYAEKLKDYVNCKTAFIGTNLIIVYPTGESYIYDIEKNLKWQGSLLFGGVGPADIAVCGEDLWCTFPEMNCIVKYNTFSMRPVLRIGNKENRTIQSPHGLFRDNDMLVVTQTKTNEIIKISLDTFTITEREKIEIPAKTYLKIGNEQYILTGNGIYQI